MHAMQCPSQQLGPSDPTPIVCLSTLAPASHRRCNHFNTVLKSVYIYMVVQELCNACSPSEVTNWLWHYFMHLHEMANAICICNASLVGTL